MNLKEKAAVSILLNEQNILYSSKNSTFIDLNFITVTFS